MSKIVFITKPIEELTEGINELEVGLITNGKPSPYPHTISMEYTGELKKDVLMTPREASEKGCPKYVADVEVRFDEETGNPSFKLASDIREKADISKDIRYVSGVNEARKKRYEEEVDALVLEKIRKQLNDPEINAIVTKIKDELPK